LSENHRRDSTPLPRRHRIVLGIGLRDGTYADQDATLCPSRTAGGDALALSTPDPPVRYLVARNDGVFLDPVSPPRPPPSSSSRPCRQRAPSLSGVLLSFSTTAASRSGRTRFDSDTADA
jgi:hypothetical protein